MTCCMITLFLFVRFNDIYFFKVLETTADNETGSSELSVKTGATLWQMCALHCCLLRNSKCRRLRSLSIATHTGTTALGSSIIVRCDGYTLFYPGLQLIMVIQSTVDRKAQLQRYVRHNACLQQGAHTHEHKVHAQALLVSSRG